MLQSQHINLISVVITYSSKTKSSLSLILKPPPKGSSNPGKCAFNYQPKDYKRRGRNVCLIYLVHCASSPHIHSLNPSRKHFISHLRQE